MIVVAQQHCPLRTPRGPIRLPVGVSAVCAAIADNCTYPAIGEWIGVSAAAVLALGSDPDWRPSEAIICHGRRLHVGCRAQFTKKYGDASTSVVRNEPYRLAADVWEIGFKTGDTIA
jgi:Helix-hairpin-helix containing domain